MPRPCAKDHDLSPQTCRLCAWCVDDSPAGVVYRHAWEVASPKCVFLGEDTGAKIKCPTCLGNVELKLFACEVHGVCTQGKKAGTVACCAGCPDKKLGGP